MVTVFTQFIAKHATAAAELESIFQKLIREVPLEKGNLAYEVLVVQGIPNSYYVIEKWISEADLQNHMTSVIEKGYAADAEVLLENELVNIIGQTLN